MNRCQTIKDGLCTQAASAWTGWGPKSTSASCVRGTVTTIELTDPRCPLCIVQRVRALRTAVVIMTRQMLPQRD
jgi:hypothetical protein